MSDEIQVELPDGTTVTLSVEQASTLGRLCLEHPGSIWHFNECGCCVCLHPSGDTARGFVIGPDGVSDYHTAAHQ